MDEKAAVAQLKRGDIHGLELLVRLYQTRAVYTACLITQDAAAAQDIVQNAFLKAYHHIQQFDDTRPFAGWFFQIVVNDALKVADGYKRFISFSSSQDLSVDDFFDSLPDTGPLPDILVETHEQYSTVQEALNKLSPSQRAVVVMRYYLELSEKETALALEVAPGTVKWYLHAAKERLRVLLAPLWEAKI